MSHISVIKLPDNSTYDIKDSSAISVNEKGAANGVVPLNGSSQIDSAYLPSYVDDVVEGYYYNEKFWKESTHTTEITGEAGKIYINLETNPATTYRYSGSTFVQIGSGGSVVTVTRDLTSGTKSATINVNGTDFDLYSTNDTTYESKDPVSGGTAVSLVTTGEKASWNAKTSNTGTVTNVTAGTGLTGGSITTSGTIALATSGATAGSYGPSADATPAYGATFNVPYVTVDAYGRVTAVSNKTVKIPASDNTWRGIQDNLTSSSSTTESLSAKQGYLLANGSARDNTKLPLAGGTMTGQIVLASAGLKTSSTAGWVADQYGNFVHQRSGAGDYWSICANDDTISLKVYYESGNVDTTGSISATGLNITGAATFGSSVSMDEATIGDLVVNGAASFTNGLTGTLTGSASSVRDYNDNKPTKFGYSTSGMTNASWIGAWDASTSGEYRLRAISPANLISNNLTKAQVTTALGYTPPTTNTTYSAGTGLSLSSTTFAVKLGYTTSGNNRAVQADSSGNLYVTQKDTTYSAGTGLSLSSTTFSLATSGATAGSYGDSAAQTPAYGGTFKVPYVTVDTYGRVTGISEHTVKIPASDNTDTKLQVAAVTSGTTYYPIVGTGTTAATRQYDTTGFMYKATDGTTSSTGNATLYLGNTSSSTTAGNKRGRLLLYGSGATYYHLIQGAPTDNRTITLPNASGTIHLASNPTLEKTGTSTIDLAASSTYTLTAGGGSVVFKTPPNTWTALSTSAAGYVAKAPNDTAKFLRGDATWAAVTKSNVGLGNVENKSSATIRGEITSSNVTTALGYTPSHQFAIIACTGEYGSNKITLNNNTITQIPLKNVKITETGNTGATLSLNTTYNAIQMKGPGFFRITASAYVETSGSFLKGVYLMISTGTFANATEYSSSMCYSTTTGGAINTTYTHQLSGTGTVYVYLAARTMGGNGSCTPGNAATYLEVEQIR